MKLLGQVERELHIVLSIYYLKTSWVEIREYNWEGEVGVGRGRFGNDWEKCNVISRGDEDWIEYTDAVFSFCFFAPHGFLT